MGGRGSGFLRSCAASGFVRPFGGFFSFMSLFFAAANALLASSCLACVIDSSLSHLQPIDDPLLDGVQLLVPRTRVDCCKNSCVSLNGE